MYSRDDLEAITNLVKLSGEQSYISISKNLNGISKKDLDAALLVLISNGQLATRTVERNGQPTKMYRKR